MAKKDPPRDPNERQSVDPAKLPKEMRELIDKEFPRAIAMALYAGCDEFDFLRVAELLIVAAEQSIEGIPPCAEALQALRGITNARTRVREAMHYTNQFSKAMEALHEIVTKHRSGIQTATVEEAERLARGKLKT